MYCCREKKKKKKNLNELTSLKASANSDRVIQSELYSSLQGWKQRISQVKLEKLKLNWWIYFFKCSIRIDASLFLSDSLYYLNLNRTSATVSQSNQNKRCKKQGIMGVVACIVKQPPLLTKLHLRDGNIHCNVFKFYSHRVHRPG